MENGVAFSCRNDLTTFNYCTFKIIVMDSTINKLPPEEVKGMTAIPEDDFCALRVKLSG